MVTPALVWLALAVVAVAGAAGWFLRGGRRRSAPIPVANTGYLHALPAFRRRLTMQRVAGVALGVLLAGAAVTTALLAGRPVDRLIRDERMAARDIVLCLDVSGSMLRFDSEVLGTYRELLPSFQGERIALNIWNATTRVVFPLTDDYGLVEEELARGAELTAIDPDSLATPPQAYLRLEEWLAGTFSYTDDNSSLIGDGLANCALSFDLADTERSRTIILATDNEVSGAPVFSLTQAAAFAAERDIRIHAVYASLLGNQAARAEYEQVITSRGGLFYQLDDPGAVNGIVADIAAQQAHELESDPKVVELDRPDRYYGALVGLVALLVVGAWRLRT